MELQSSVVAVSYTHLKDQQRSPMQMGDQEDQEILVTELRQHAALVIREERNGGVADHGEGCLLYTSRCV